MGHGEGDPEALDPWGAETHRVENVPPPLEGHDVYATDAALREAVHREGAAGAEASLSALGGLVGRREIIELGFDANAHRPRFDSHDRRGVRVDEVRFHPAYHELMQLSIEHGIHASHWAEPGPGAHVARAARFYLVTQVEAGHTCPITMTSAAIPALRHQPELFDAWAPKILARVYDPRNVPADQKRGVTLGMAMTEKQGGSDVRANSTRAIPVDRGGPGAAHELVGHKYFVSAPMSDAFLVLAQAPGGLSCFLLPRWRPDGTKNPLQIQRLKDKMGNVSNASSETELRGALAWQVGEEGRGVRTIIDMVAMTRFDCMIGSTGGMRQAVAQALHHCAHRRAFGKRLVEQPLMRNVLADLVVEHEAALALAMRIARALDARAEDHEDRLVRIGTAIGKYWICKRTASHAVEAMECIGGSGVMEECIMPRLFRESPINAIWEGSGNVQCLDVLRAMRRTPGSVESFLEEVDGARGGDGRLDRFLDATAAELRDEEGIEYRARRIVERMALAIQGALLVRSGDPAVADAFCASRLDGQASGSLYGALPPGVDTEAILERAMPAL